MHTNRRSTFDLRRCVPMERAEEHRCASEYVKTRDPSLAERLITANMRLVVTIARKYRRGYYDTRDLIQEGNLGLLQAVRRYDPDRGVKLSSYAAWWIRAYILKFTIDTWRLVRVGTTRAERRLFFRLRQERNTLETRGVEPSVKELATTLGVKESEVTLMLERFAAGEMSLDTTGSQESTGPAIGDLLSSAPLQRPDVQVENDEFVQALQHKLKVFEGTLGQRDLEIFQRRLFTDEPVTLVSLAAGFGVTRERTRQLEQRLKGRIRDYLEREMGDALPRSRTIEIDGVVVESRRGHSWRAHSSPPGWVGTMAATHEIEQRA